MAEGARRKRRAASGKASAAGALGVAGIAAAGAAVIGFTPTLCASPQLTAQLYYLRGTNIGDEPSDDQFNAFVSTVISGTGTPAPDTPYQKVPYNAGFWPVSKGGLGDLTWDASVQQGLTNLGAEPLQSNDVIFGFSQGAVVASRYKNDHPDAGHTYVLVENPNRPNGGVLERFKGLHIPILDVSFNGATPGNGDLTIDVARQYDGWADFPTYPLNVLATANAIMGIVYLHGKTQTEITAADISQIDTSKNSMYYQYDPETNTKYYLLPTKELPLLMPFNGIVPDPILKALDPPLRFLIELGYDRSDYSQPTPAKLIPDVDPGFVTTGPDDAQTQTISDHLSAAEAVGPKGAAVPADDSKTETESPRTARHGLPTSESLPKPQEQQRASLPDSSSRKPTTDPVRSISKAVKAFAPRHTRPDAPSHTITGLDDPVGSISTAVKSFTRRHAGVDKPESPSQTTADKAGDDQT